MTVLLLPGAVRFCPRQSDLAKQQPNQRLKLAARVDYGMNCSSARRSLSAIR